MGKCTKSQLKWRWRVTSLRHVESAAHIGHIKATPKTSIVIVAKTSKVIIAIHAITAHHSVHPHAHGPGVHHSGVAPHHPWVVAIAHRPVAHHARVHAPHHCPVAVAVTVHVLPGVSLSSAEKRGKRRRFI